MTKQDSFARVAGSYDLLVDWEKRLAREMPFLTELFARHAARRVLDVGCGTGEHARAFARAGLEAVGVDPSRAMLTVAREHTKGPNPRFVEAEMATMCSVGGDFDAVTVLGNTLSLAGSARGVEEALAGCARALRSGGVLTVQVVNYDALRTVGATRWLPVVERVVDGRTHVFLREYRNVGRLVELSVIHAVRAEGWSVDVERALHYPLTSARLQRILSAAGFTQIRLSGGYSGDAFDAGRSDALVATATLR